MSIYLIANGPMQTTAAFAPVTTGVAIKTMLQVKPGARQAFYVAEWGVSFDGSAAATPIRVELIETNVAATVTAAVTGDITRLDGCALSVGDPVTSSAVFEVGTTATGYTATSEGSIATVRNLDGPQFIAPTNQYVKQFPLGEQPFVQPAQFLRIRVTAGAAVNCYCYVKLRS